MVAGTPRKKVPQKNSSRGIFLLQKKPAKNPAAHRAAGYTRKIEFGLKKARKKARKIFHHSYLLEKARKKARKMNDIFCLEMYLIM